MEHQRAHAKERPPSAAARWVPCPASVNVVPLYPNSSSAASEKGDLAHLKLEDGILFGVLPDTDDPDMDMNIIEVLEWVEETKKAYGDCVVYAERQYDIPETGEFGTCDVTFVTPDILHLADYKNGYVMTDAREQMLTYLLGARAVFGPRNLYRVSVLQPNYNHIDGTYRTVDVTPAELDDFAAQVVHAVASNYFKAGPHCKKTYCPHRGACVTFLDWCETEGADAYYTSEINSFDDDRLARALDQAEVHQGLRDELRKEAMRRIMHHNRQVRGYKIVKSRQQRDFAGEEGREACYTALLEMGYKADDLYEKKPFKVGAITLHEQTPLSVAGVERMVKQKYKHFKRGTWKAIWDAKFAPHIRNFSGSLTLERATDGRPSHTRGSEFGSIAAAPSPLEGISVL